MISRNNTTENVNMTRRPPACRMLFYHIWIQDTKRTHDRLVNKLELRARYLESLKNGLEKFHFFQKKRLSRRVETAILRFPDLAGKLLSGDDRNTTFSIFFTPFRFVRYREQQQNPFSLPDFIYHELSPPLRRTWWLCVVKKMLSECCKMVNVNMVTQMECELFVLFSANSYNFEGPSHARNKNLAPHTRTNKKQGPETKNNPRKTSSPSGHSRMRKFPIRIRLGKFPKNRYIVESKISRKNKK